jgi:hypothetical protein
MPQFPTRRTQPMRADSYRRIARLLRGIADRLEQCAGSDDPHDKAALTQRLATLARAAREWNLRHRATIYATLYMPGAASLKRAKARKQQPRRETSPAAPGSKSAGGRPPILGTTLKRVLVTLDERTLSRARELCGGNLSAGIRAALARKR